MHIPVETRIDYTPCAVTSGRLYPFNMSSSQANEEVSRLLASTKAHLVGEGEEPSADVVAQVANEVYAQDLLNLMVVHMPKFEFEVRRHTIAA